MLVISIASLLSGCDKREGTTGTISSSSPAVAASGTGAPQTRPVATAVGTGQPERPSGPLTADWLKKANLSINIYTPGGEHVPVADALAQAKARLGEPTFVEKSSWAWGVVSADSCAAYQITEKDGKAYSDGLMSAESNGGRNTAFGECLAKLGKKPPKTP